MILSDTQLRMVVLFVITFQLFLVVATLVRILNQLEILNEKRREGSERRYEPY